VNREFTLSELASAGFAKRMRQNSLRIREKRHEVTAVEKLLHPDPDGHLDDFPFGTARFATSGAVR